MRYRSKTIQKNGCLAANINDFTYLIHIDKHHAPFGGIAATPTLLLVNDRAYFIYIGRTRINMVYDTVTTMVGVAGSGAQTAEIGLFSTPSPPNGAGQTLTKIAATGSLDALTGTGTKGNSVALAAQVPQGTYLWAGMRTAMATSQPTCGGVGRDYATGRVLTLSTAGALTSNSTFSGSLVADSTSSIAPYLEVR